MSKEYLTRVEGHGNLKIDFNQNKAQILVEEEERLFEQLVIGYPFKRAPFITARICGICPTAHYLAAIKAIESAFDIKSTPATVKLRELLLAGQIIQSHALHLFFLSLPDYTNSSTVKSFSQKYPAEFHLGLALKKASDLIVNTVGGREVHPLVPQVGGFEKKPTLKQIRKIAEEIESVIDEAQDTVRLFDRIDYPQLQPENNDYLTLKKNDQYPLYQGEDIKSYFDYNFKTEDYQDHIKEEERRGTLVKFAHHRVKKEKINFMVGALARLNNNHFNLRPISKSLLERSGLNIPSFNPFDNLRAQAIEIVHYLEIALKIAEELTEKDLNNLQSKFKPKAGQGVGAVEAPRGVLYHYYKLNSKGEIIKADIITPTSQNMLALEQDADELINVFQERTQPRKEKLVEQLIRAYDPCLTCSVH